MVRSIARMTLIGALILIVLIILSGIVVINGTQEIQRTILHLTTTAIPWIENSHGYDLAVRSAIADAHQFLLSDDLEELAESEKNLSAADTALHNLLLVENTGIDLTDHVDPERTLIDMQRTAIHEDTKRLISQLSTQFVNDPQQKQSFSEDLEHLEQELADLNDQQLELRQHDTIELTNQVNTLFYNLLIVILAICTILTSTLIFLFIAVRHWVLRPLAHLAYRTTAIGQGNYAQEIETSGVAEIGALQHSFQQMTVLLSARNQALQQEIQKAEQALIPSEEAQQHSIEQLTTIQDQQQQIREMSLPILPVGEEVMVMPLIGTLNADRLSLLQSQALSTLERTRARYLLLDVTGVPLVDQTMAHRLVEVVQSAKLLGTQVALVGIQPEVAQTIVGLGIALSDIPCYATLEDGLQNIKRGKLQ